MTDLKKEAGTKVLFVASVYAHLVAFHIPFMQLLQRRGYEVHAAAAQDDCKCRILSDLGVVCRNVPFSRSPFSPVNAAAYRSLKQLLLDEHYELVHLHTPVAAFLGRLAAAASNQKHVLYTAHGFHFYRKAPLVNWLLYYPSEKLAARWTDGLIVMNHEDFMLGERLGFRPGQDLFHVHGVGVDLRTYSGPAREESRLRVELGVSPEEVVVTCIAELSARKNQRFLIKAWERVSRNCSNCVLLLVGDGSDKDALMKVVERKKIPRVRFLGYRGDIPAILANTDIIALVSKHEGLPRCIMEAMAAGKPVVASRVRGNRDLVDDKTTGLLVRLGDVVDLSRAIEMLIRSPELRSRMGQAGFGKIRPYCLEAVLHEMDAIYAGFLGADNGNPRPIQGRGATHTIREFSQGR